MNRIDFTHWQRCCASLALTDSLVISWHRRLLSAYSEPQRAYHSLQHLEECLLLLDETKLERRTLVEMALWFHDAVYNPRATDNEEQSAALAEAALIEGRIANVQIAVVKRLIMVTKSHQPSDDIDEQTLADIDLAVLGASPARFDEYESQIQSEYAWVPENTYRAKRAEILHGFLKREHLYRTTAFQVRFEAQARLNLQRLILALL